MRYTLVHWLHGCKNECRNAVGRDTQRNVKNKRHDNDEQSKTIASTVAFMFNLIQILDELDVAKLHGKLRIIYYFLQNCRICIRILCVNVFDVYRNSYVFLMRELFSLPI